MTGRVRVYLIPSLWMLFIPIDLPTTLKLKIRRKDILDKLNPFLKANSFCTDNRFFDKPLIIEGSNGDEIQRFFKSKLIQKVILKTFEMKELVYVGVNEMNVDFVPALYGKSHLSIFKTGEWLLEDSIIEKLFALIEECRLNL